MIASRSQLRKGWSNWTVWKCLTVLCVIQSGSEKEESALALLYASLLKSTLAFDNNRKKNRQKWQDKPCIFFVSWTGPVHKMAHPLPVHKHFKFISYFFLSFFLFPFLDFYWFNQQRHEGFILKLFFFFFLQHRDGRVPKWHSHADVFISRE